jgi:hypothetical protein
LTVLEKVSSILRGDGLSPELSQASRPLMPSIRLHVFATVLVAAAFLFSVLPGCKSDSSTGASGTITVTGKVITSTLVPVPNSPVVITGRPATTTDANGSFSVTDVTVPYDVTIVVSTSKLAIVYRGLTRPDPMLVNILALGSGANTATVGGTLSGGGGYPEPATRTSRAYITSTDASASATANATTGAYTSTFGWSGSTTLTAVLRALQWDKNAAGMPTAYTGYGEKTGVSITAGGAFASQNIAMTAAASQNISGTVTVPAALTLSSKSLGVTFSAGDNFTLGSESGTGTAFTYPVPVITGATFSVSAAATGAAGQGSIRKTGIAAGTANIAITIPTLPTQSLPVNAATGVDTTTSFSWAPVTSSIYLVLFNGPPNQPDYLVITSETSTKIPNLSSLGMGLPQGIGYTWLVMGYGPYVSVDAAAGSGGLISQGDALVSTTTTRTLTTAP